jgi:hypothetical protein
MVASAAAGPKTETSPGVGGSLAALLSATLRREERQTAVKRILARALVGLIGALSVLYVGDWAVWRARVAMGGGMGSVSVGTLIETPLKGNKMEYDWGGSSDVACSRSIFPQAGGGACWWLERHKVVYEQ